MFRAILFALLFLACQNSLATAAEDNFNTTAFKEGTTNGSTNANCSAAISWWCQQQLLAEVNLEPVPGPALNVAAGIILLVAAYYARRRR